MNNADLLTTDQAAELLEVERRSVYTYAQRLAGFPQPVKIGRTLLFDRQALLDWRAHHPARRKRDSPPARRTDRGVDDSAEVPEVEAVA